MSSDRDTTRIVRSWLREDGHENADRVLDLVLDQIDTTPQRRATWWPVRRPLTMNNTIRYGVAAAVLTLATLVGFTLLNNQVGNEPTPTPSPSDTALVPPPAGLQHPFIGQPKPIVGLGTDVTAAILTFDGTTFKFFNGSIDVLGSAVSLTESGQLKLTTVLSGHTCEVGDEGLYDYSLSPGGSRLTISGTDDCAPREAAVVGEWQKSDCRNPDNFCLGNLEAGTYSSNYFEPRPQGEWAPRFGALTFTVPEGWAAAEDFPEGYGLLTQQAYAAADPAAEGCAACPDSIGIWAAPQAMAHDCSEKAASGVGTSAADLADWVVNNPDFRVDQQQSVTVDGRPAIVLDLGMAEGATPVCGDSGEAGVPVFFNGWALGIAAGDRQRFILVDLAGGDTIVINIDTLDPATLGAFVAQAMPIVQTFHFPPR
ncbi:MAG TPA: hypothetical protein VES36_08395 [Candidatus Limnocylindrales bacterium]|nr:hypothetical protein [Candidatus Limnocylindrales bacterium]